MNRRHIFPLTLVAVLAIGAATANAAEHVLDGRTLTVDELWAISAPGETVKISEEGMKRLRAGYKAPIIAAEDGRDIYGLTVNYGALKEKRVTDGEKGKAGVEEEPNRSASIAFNERQMRIQAAGFEPFLPERTAKMAMVIRLNQMAAGYTAMSEDAARAYAEYVNNDVTPLIPSKGSEGANDLSFATHIGLALMGEWDVMWKGERRKAADVRKELGLKPFHPFGLDGISILSNSNVGEAQAVTAVKKVEHLLNFNAKLVATSLEALNGNVTPFLWHTVETKGWPMQHEASEAILENLKGSYLWEKDEKRYLQDPLSFRSAGYILAAAMEEVDQAKSLLTTAINHTTDNPIVNTEVKTDRWYSKLPAVVMNEAGSPTAHVNSCANFDNTQLALQLESVGRALAQVMHASAWRTTQLVDSHRTQLPTYLVAPENKGGDGFANIAQSMSGIYAEGMALTNSVMGYGVPTSIGIEETFSNVNVAADRLDRLSECTAGVFAYEILHTTQAMDIRTRTEKRALGEGTSKLLASYRTVVPYVDHDRIFTTDLQRSLEWVLAQK